MNTIKQRIWDYLDNACTVQERKAIEALIETDSAYRSAYDELMAVNGYFSKMELDEPSMGFTRNLMEKLSNEPVPGSLKQLIDKRIIYGIAGFFLVTILVLLLLMFSQVNWAAPLNPDLQAYSVPNVNIGSYINNTMINCFFFIDVILGLYVLDGFLRKKLHHK